MHPRYIRSLHMTLAAVILAPCAIAMEAATATNDRASQAAPTK